MLIKIKLIGWSGFNHSYSIILESYFRPLIKNKHVKLFFEEAEPFRGNWRKYKDTFLETLEKPQKDDHFDIAFKSFYPYDFTPDKQSTSTIIFTTCEFNVIHGGLVDTTDLYDNVWLLTPSEFSKNGIIRSGISKEKIYVVPHGYKFNRLYYTKKELRRKYNIVENDFVFFHNSALTPNKNGPLIFTTFNKIYNKNPQVTLLIKGSIGTYNSHEKVNEYLNLLDENCKAKVFFLGEDVDDDTLTELYQMSDCYIAPYIAEGFNMPVLEALCNNLQVICTKNGPTDEFVCKDDIFFVNSELIDSDISETIEGKLIKRQVLYPYEDDFYQNMQQVLQRRKHINVTHYITQYSEENISDKLLEVLKSLCRKKYANKQINACYIAQNYNDLFDIKINIRQLRLFNPDTKIYIGIRNDICLNKIKTNEKTFISQVFSDTLEENIKELKMKYNIGNITYIETTNFIYYNLIFNKNIRIACGSDNIKWELDRKNQRIPYVNNWKIKVLKLNITEIHDNYYYSKCRINKDDILSGSRFQTLADITIVTPKLMELYPDFRAFSCKSLLVDDDLANYVKFQINVDYLKQIDEYKTIFIFNDYLESFFETIWKLLVNKHNIITHSGNTLVNETFVKYIVDPKLIKLYTINCSFKHAKIVSIPLGIANFHVKHFAEYYSEIIKNKDFSNKKNNIIIYADTITNDILKFAKELKPIHSPNHVIDIIRVSDKFKIEVLNEYKYCFCMIDDIVDINLFWYCIYFNVVPIIKSNYYTISNTKELPIINIANWNELLNPKVNLNKLYNEIVEKEIPKASLTYYKNLINK